MILVTGATGTIGSSLVGKLKAADVPIRVLTRNPEKAEGLDVDVAAGDFADPASLDAALAGVETVFLLSGQHPDQATLQGNVVKAASRAGAKRIVKLSAGSGVTGADSPSFAGRFHAQTEREIEQAGLAYTFLQPNWFMQNLFNMAEPIKAKNLLPLAFLTDDQRMALIDTEDIAAVSARVLAEPGPHDGETYRLSGPELLTGPEIAERLGRGLGRDVNHASPPVEAFLETLKAKGAPDWMQQHMKEIAELFRDGAGAEQTDTVEQLLGRPPRTVEEFAREHAHRFS